MKLAAPDDGTDIVQDGVTGSKLVSARVVAGGRSILVIIDVGIRVNFKYIVFVGIKRDYLSSCGLQVFHKVDYHVAMGSSRILIEVSVLTRCVGDIQPGTILQEIELS